MKALKILVTGGSGQLGSELRDIWQSGDIADLVFLDRQDLDLSHPELVQSVLGVYHPDYIVHSAAFTAVDLAETEVDLANRVNHLSTLEISKYAKSRGCRLIYISTDYVFPGNADQALDENYPTDPINVYGRTKRSGEEAIEQNCPDAIIIRTSWVYSTFGKNFVKTMMNLMKSRQEISVVSDQIGSPTYARDLAELIEHIVVSGPWVPGTYHYSNEGRASWYDFAVKIRDVSGLQCKVHPIPSSSFPTPAKRPHFSLLDKGKVRTTFGINVPQWQDSLERMMAKLSERSK
ncbi:dTDP-4-dehydrorhamnose reductase [Sphingobacterium sp.]|uniref:dTDP-4-dehydrorhamnose reductase n=1 Tax=Sphingobacterium sp. TaxID=341027 RepID=UPI0028A7BCC7|nr:dTDP-4-dehydrorhamnose reductase [Sphingobacterium sp.]